MPETINKIKEVPVKYRLQGIELLDVCLNHNQQVMTDIKGFHFDIKLEHKINVDKKIIVVVNYITVFNESRNFKFGSLTSSCIFEVDNISDFINTNDERLKLPDDFVTSINSITISTARGIMFSQFKGTSLHNAFLPIIDPQSFKK